MQRLPYDLQAKALRHLPLKRGWNARGDKE